MGPAWFIQNLDHQWKTIRDGTLVLPTDECIDHHVIDMTDVDRAATVVFKWGSEFVGE